MFGELIKQNYFIVACYIITALYVGFSNTLLTDKIKNILNNEITKLILLALIILVGEHSIELSIALTIVVLVSLLVANSHSKENFLNANITVCPLYHYQCSITLFNDVNQKES